MGCVGGQEGGCAGGIVLKQLCYLSRGGLDDIAGVTADEGVWRSVKGRASFGRVSDGFVYQLDSGIVLFDDVRGVCRAGSSYVSAGVWCAAEAACIGRLMSVSECEFAIV